MWSTEEIKLNLMQEDKYLHFKVVSGGGPLRSSQLYM